MKLSKIFIINICLLIVLKLLLEYSYINFVYKYYSYAGYDYIYSHEKYIIGWIVYIIGYFFIKTKQNLYFYEIYIFLYLIYILPNIIYYSLSNQLNIYFIAIIFPYFIIVLLSTKKSFFNVSFVRMGKPIVLFIALFFVLLVIGHSIVASHGNMVLSFQDVYTFRDKFGADNTSGAFGYINNWSTKIFAPLLLGWSIYTRKKTLILLSIVFIILMFIFSGHKGISQAAILPIFFYFLFKSKRIETLMIISFLFLILSAIIISNFYNAGMLASLVIRRLLFVPAQLNFTYLEFFSNHDFVFWSNSILKYFINYPYQLEATHVIGAYLGHPDEAANNGFVASGFMHAGYIGIVIYTFIVIVIFNVISTMSKKIDKFIVYSIVFISVKVLFTSSDLLSTLLTHGLLIIIGVLWLYENKQYVLKLGKIKFKL